MHLFKRRTVRAGIAASFFVAILWQASAHAQSLETEPNDECETAQDVGDLVPPFDVTGSLDTPPDVPDVDRYLVSADPGSRLDVALGGATAGAGSLQDPFLGLFTSGCELLEINDDHFSLDSFLQVVVPSDGRFILAVSSCCDGEFTGTGGGAGTYTLSVTSPPPPIGSISARLSDALTGEPVPGDSPPWAQVELRRCSGEFCFETVSVLNPNSEGRVRFETDFSGQSLRAGAYQLNASANDYRDATSDRFDVAAGENIDIGDIAILPPLIAISNANDCDALLPQGGVCRFTVRISNNTEAPLVGLAWSVIDAFGLGSTLDYSTYEARAENPPGDDARRVSLTLGARESLDYAFDFTVPGFVRDGATYCARLFVGLEPSPLANTTRETQLFCLTKGEVAFRLLNDAESQKAFLTLAGSTDAFQVPRPGLFAKD